VFDNYIEIKINSCQFLKKTVIFIVFFCLTHISFSQNIVVSEYFNGTDTRDEWTELLVVNDNTDLRGYNIRDNNSSQTSWQTEVVFSNNNFWNNLRAGTIIIIWHRIRSSSSSTNRIVDTIKSDGYIEVHAQLSGYFSGGDFGTASTWSGASLSISASADIIQIRDFSNNHVHALGHKYTDSTDFIGIVSTNKLNHASSLSSGENVYVCPGSSLSEYIGAYSGTTWTSKGSTNITQGLPNYNSSSPTFPNRNYWRSLRQPIYNSPTLNTILTNTEFTQANLTWNACTDPNPGDSTTGYIILRDTINSFTNPSDSIVYAVGSSIGTAKVIANINYSSTLNFTDNYAFACGETYYYKIYAFRFGNDNINGNSYNASRGRAYNEMGTNIISILKSIPLTQPIIAN
jgi:hypothetical protein